MSYQNIVNACLRIKPSRNTEGNQGFMKIAMASFKHTCEKVQ